jgi:hypothetical protein
MHIHLKISKKVLLFVIDVFYSKWISFVLGAEKKKHSNRLYIMQLCQCINEKKGMKRTLE